MKPTIKSSYTPGEFEKSVAQYWDENHTYATGSNPKAEKMYTLSMFPYPSGAGLHTGHGRIFTGTDVLARYYRMKGYNVLHPMGWDAFGLPTENAAIKEKRNPFEVTSQNVATFKRQMKALGLSYDWSREINTTDPNYYKTTQSLFIEFFKHGLLYKKDTPVYYCEFCKTGLAQEEVVQNGTHERCGNLVTKKNLPQWIFKITAYADELLNSLEGLEWPRGILEMQKNWIGKKEGLVIAHKVEGMDVEIQSFTAYPAWSYADTYIVIAPEHSIVAQLVEGTEYEQAVADFIKEYRAISEEDRLKNKFEKKGVFTGRYAIDPFTGNKMPIWLANFALLNFGTGIVRCSAHDERDYEFAQKYNIPVKEVVKSNSEKPVSAHTNKGLLVDSGEFSGKEINEELIEEMTEWMKSQGFAETYVSYNLRDWIFSRQRYWGEPIPMVHCQECAKNKISYWNSGKFDLSDLRLNKGPKNKPFKEMVAESEPFVYGWFPLELSGLPLELPQVESYEPSETGESPLSQLKDWKKVSCPHCGGVAERETDSMPNWAGSCWYFLAFIDPKDPLNAGQMEKWMPVDWYLGGAEHAVLHLLYARFWMHALYDLGSVTIQEPFKRLRNVGMVLSYDGQKMSKSKGNVINPDEIISEAGADALRVYVMFMAPFNQEVTWSTETLQGSKRFLSRIWQIYTSSDKLTDQNENEDRKLVSELQKLIQKITLDLSDVKFNTPIAGMMEFLNLWERSEKGLSINQSKIFLQLLSPFAPFVTEKLWQTVCKEEGSIHNSVWPEADLSLILDENLEIPVQINGKVRGSVFLEQNNLDQDKVYYEALKVENIKKWIFSEPKKIIYVKGKIMNIIV